MRVYRHCINQLQTSPSPSLSGKKVQHACCTLYSMPSLHTVCCSNNCATLHHLHNTNGNRVLQSCNALYPRYRNVSAAVNLRVVLVGKRCQTSCTTTSHAALCIIHFAGRSRSHVDLHGVVRCVFPRTIRSTLSVPSLGAFSFEYSSGSNSLSFSLLHHRLSCGLGYGYVIFCSQFEWNHGQIIIWGHLPRLLFLRVSGRNTETLFQHK